MRYMGSKNKMARHLLPVILPRRKPGQWWVEPFVGGANMIDKVSGLRIGIDINPYLIALLRAVQLGWSPPNEITEDEYRVIKDNKDDHPPELVGFVGFLCSFGGKFFGGYARDRDRNSYASRGCRALTKQRDGILGVIFRHGSYLDLHIPPRSLIYCDPPYQSTTQYKGAAKFDHAVFWGWCRAKHDEGHTVFVSEYHAPDDFECVLSVSHKTTLARGGGSSREEKLFRPKN